MKFKDIPVGHWFSYRDKLYQRMRNLNGSNAYCFTDGDYGCVEPEASVLTALGPRHAGYSAAKPVANVLIYSDHTCRVESIGELDALLTIN